MQKWPAPSNLSISRNKTKLTFKWKLQYTNVCSKYKQELQYRYHYRHLGSSSWVDIDISSKKRSKTITVSGLADRLSDIKAIEFRVRMWPTDSYADTWGKSEWSTSRMNLDVPTKPKVSFTKDSSYDNKGTFKWEQTTSDTGKRPWTNEQWEFVQRTNYYGSTGSKAFGSGADKRDSGIVDKTTGSYSSSVAEISTTPVRHILRVRSLGPRGASAWVYSNHSYAIPRAPQLNSASLSQNSNGTYTLQIKATTKSDAARPVEKVTAEYTVVTPGKGMTCPAGGSWTSAMVMAWKTGQQTMAPVIDISIPNNECVFARAKSQHDNSCYGYSGTALVYKGTLSAPSLEDSVTLDTTEGTVTLTTTNNASAVEDSKIYAEYSINKGVFRKLGIIPHEAGEQTLTDAYLKGQTVKNYQIRVKTVVYDSAETKIVWESAWEYSDAQTYAVAPANVKASVYSSDTALLEWDWSWSDATAARIAWSDHEDAWNSTDSPSTCDMEDITTWFHVTNLEEKTYYFRIRLIDKSGDKDIYGPWSDTISLDMSATPAVPTLNVENPYTNIEGSITCLVSTTGTGTIQIAENVNDKVVVLAASTSNSITLSVEDINAVYTSLGLTSRIWKEGETHSLTANVIANGGEPTEWSDSIAINVVETPVISSMTYNLTYQEVIDDPDDEDAKHWANVLTALPLGVKFNVNDTSYTCKLAIIRDKSGEMARPDDTKTNVYEGEVVYATTSTGGMDVYIFASTLTGHLDDNAEYTIVCTATDSYGQTATETIPFEVHWTHQPVIPSITALETLTDDLATKITVAKPDSYELGDCFDIYRLSADKPELVLADCEYDTAYVDPYPAFGEFGGHRIVSKTANGDYITEDNEFAWIDTDKDWGDYIDSKEIVVDFNGQRINLPYGISLSNSWSKDFTRTTYLGGSVAGDWNPAVTRDLSVSTTVLAVIDPDTIKAMRALAAYTGICHIRTPEGSSFACDIQVSESREGSTQKVVSFSLTIKQVDTEGFDGMTYAQWVKESE